MRHERRIYSDKEKKAKDGQKADSSSINLHHPQKLNDDRMRQRQKYSVAKRHGRTKSGVDVNQRCYEQCKCENG